MIINEFKDGQGLGNQLWCYASAKSIAMKNNTALILKNYKKFKGNNFLDLKFDIKYKNQKFEVFNELLYYDHDLDYVCSYFDKRVEKLSSKKNFCLEGLFQSEKYFFNKDKFLKKWISVNLKEEISLSKDTCIINLRGGEYKRHKKFILPISYWQNSINYMKDSFNISQFIVVTDDYPYAKALFPKYQIISGDVELCFNYIYSCSNIIVSNSTFSYFPITLSSVKKNVLAPVNWARFGNDKNRWISPANFYKNWLYIDQNNNVFNYKKLIHKVNDTVNYYIINKMIFNKSDVKKSFRHYIPKKIKVLIKKIGSRFFPKHIG